MESILVDPLEVGRKGFATFIAMVVRNAMEDFHTKHLSDAQMKELNPIIRNAIYTAMFAFENKDELAKAGRFFEYHNSMVPKYWESPKLTVDFSDKTDKGDSVPGKHTGHWPYKRWQSKK
jgi:hypothetical protein